MNNFSKSWFKGWNANCKFVEHREKRSTVVLPIGSALCDSFWVKTKARDILSYNIFVWTTIFCTTWQWAEALQNMLSRNKVCVNPGAPSTTLLSVSVELKIGAGASLSIVKRRSTPDLGAISFVQNPGHSCTIGIDQANFVCSEQIWVGFNCGSLDRCHVAF